MEKTIIQDVLNELIKRGYFKTNDGFFYRKCNEKPLIIDSFTHIAMETKVMEVLRVYKQTLPNDTELSDIVLILRMVEIILDNLPIYKIELIKVEYK